MDKNMNDLLKWSIENTTPSSDAPATATAATAAAPSTTNQGLNAELLAQIMGGPSDGELMKAAMEVITDTDPEVTLENKLIAFDNLEQLIESLENAKHLDTLALWTPLLDLLEHEEHDLRRMAAWCVGTAVQNNEHCQARLLAVGGIPPLVALATKEEEKEAVRRKGIYALSSAVRNYQPAMDAATEELAKRGHHESGEVDATNMDAVDGVINSLRAKVPKATA